MKLFDFETVPERRGHDSIAANMIPFEGVEPETGFEPIPMWVADMSFVTAPCILEAIRSRLEERHFGYFDPSDAYYAAIRYWQEKRHGVTGIGNEAIGYENGVLGGVASAVTALTAPGEGVLIHTPCYIGFLHTLQDLGRPVVESPLRRDKDGIWRMDYADMRRKIEENSIRLAIFCSPHNPTGRVWDREEIEAAMAVYRDTGCTVISDEIWSDLIVSDKRHVPTQSVSEDARQRTMALYAPSKTFSLAGLVGSYHIIYNPALRERITAAAEGTKYNGSNVLSMHALIGAFSEEGDRWLRELNEVLRRNAERMTAFFRAHGVNVAQPEGTYMLLPDFSDYCSRHQVTIDEIQHRGIRCGVIWQDGRAFLLPDSIRMNLALPEARLEEAIARLEQYVLID